MSNHGLSKDHINIIRSVLSPYAQKIENVGLFGSRATGTYRPNSDIDMVIYGKLNEEELSHIWTSFNDSSLPIKVDVQVYDLISYPPLKRHIDEVMQPLAIDDN